MYKFVVASWMLAVTGFASQASAQGLLFDDTIVLPRVGVASAGWGESSIRTDCDGSTAGCLLLGGQGEESSDRGVEGDGPTAVLGLDVLARLTGAFWLGGQFAVQPGLEFEDEDTGVETDLGTTFSLLGVGEYRIEASPGWTVPLRGQVGLVMVKQGDDLEDTVQAAEDVCDLYDDQSGQECGSRGPLGFQLGASAGVAYRVGDVGLRVDVGYVFDWLRLYRLRFDSDSADAVRKHVGKWNRFHIMFGLEL